MRIENIMEKNIMVDENTINQCSVVLTRNCNLRCNFCYVKDAGYCENEIVSFENLKKIVNFCCDRSEERRVGKECL